MKNKGFTLVELISILTILAIIALITIPVMTKTIKNAEQKSLNEQKQVIINAAKKYALDISDELPEYDGDVYIITVSKLRNSAYLNEDNIVDPTTNKAMNGCVRVTYVGSKGNYKYEYSTDCQTYAASPALDKNMLPVVYKNNRWETVGNSKWYDYANKEWANAVIVKNISKYNELDAGVEVLDEDIVAHFVWIPRFSYAIQKKNASGTVTYGYNSTAIATPGYVDIKFTSKSTIDLGAGYYYGKNPSGYRTPDAFYQDLNEDGVLDPDEQLRGIWVGKFETGLPTNHECSVAGNYENCNIVHKDNIYIKNNLPSMRFQNQFHMFQTAFNLGRNYKLEAETRQMKNAEWGAVMYLANSIYGRCTTSSCTKITPNQNASFMTGGGNYKSNVAQSTTGNITGVYDMAGGSWEVTSSFLNGMYGNSGFDFLPKLKYYDNYTAGIMSTACAGDICFGHGLSETSGWFKALATFMNNDRTGLARGGDYMSSNYNGFDVYDESFLEGKSTFRIAIAMK